MSGAKPARAILLAAGRGLRLRSVHSGPKCLLDLAGQSLLERHLRALADCDVPAGIVTGHEARAIEAALEKVDGVPRPGLRFNPDFERGSVLSLWCASPWLVEGGDVLLMDADVLCDPEVLRRLVRAQGSSALLVDRDYDDTGGEAVKVCLREGRVVEFRKQVSPELGFDFAAESVGFFRFAERDARRLAARAYDYVRAGRLDEPCEEVIRDLLLESPERYAALDVTGLAWLEIDFPQDVARARAEILPRMERAAAARG